MDVGVASALDDLCRSNNSNDDAAPEPKEPDSIDIYHKPDGTPIICPACYRRKDSPDLVNPAQTLAWNMHGHPDDASRHSKLCAYDDFVWHKLQYYHLSAGDYVDFRETEDGQREGNRWIDQLVQLKKTRGPKCRVTATAWTTKMSCSTPWTSLLMSLNAHQRNGV